MIIFASSASLKFLAPQKSKKSKDMSFSLLKKTRRLQPGLPQRVVHACGRHAAATGCHSGTTQHLDAATVAGGTCCGAAQATHRKVGQKWRDSVPWQRTLCSGRITNKQKSGGKQKKGNGGESQRFFEGIFLFYFGLEVVKKGFVQVAFLWEFKVHVDRSAAEIKSSQTSHRDVRKGGDLEGKDGWCGVGARHGLCCDSANLNHAFLVEGKIFDRW